MENTENTQNPKKPNMKWLRPAGAVFIAVCILAAGFGGGMYYEVTKIGTATRLRSAKRTKPTMN